MHNCFRVVTFPSAEDCNSACVLRFGFAIFTRGIRENTIEKGVLAKEAQWHYRSPAVARLCSGMFGGETTSQEERVGYSEAA